ncbi:MAG: large-conductance mechanosensitive channel protein MscL [Clostridia bacterium]|nr:large-conductance mechanosensitive channel protein MscL [Clostridia bacterium]NLS86296.1 large-conductance mechanosensitive channel protein MscL [Oscillospiraceae bacterium]
MKKFFEEFKAFAMRGNVLDMAVGVVIGTAFTAIVNSLVKDIFMPIIGMITGGIDFSGLSATIGSANLTYGNFIQAVVQFILIAFCVFCVVKGINKFKKPETPVEVVIPEPTAEEKLLAEILDELKKQGK